MSRGWVLVAFAGSVLAVADAVVSAFWPIPLPTFEVVLHVAIGAAWIGAGLVAWARHPELRIGPLMAAVGFAWYMEEPWWLAAVPNTLAFLLDDLGLAVGLHAVLAFPSGRLRTPLDRGLVAAGYAAVLIGNLSSALVYDPALDGCPECGRNLLLIHHSPAVQDVINLVLAVAAAAIGVIAVAVLVRRWQSATAAGRAVLGPVVLAAAVSGALYVAWNTVDAVGTAPDWLFWLSWLALGLVPVAFLAGLLGARLRRGAMTGLMVELAQLPPPRRVRDALAEALGDPTLGLVFWMPDDRRYVDLDGRATELPEDDPSRAVTVLEQGGERFAALLHDPFLYEDRELLEAVGAAARLAVENSRLQARLRAQLAEVRASRARIVAAGDAERRRLERDLHDGAQQRLIGIRLALRLARSRVGHDDAEVEDLLREADDELMAGLDELRSLARGIHPAVLTDEGLGAALTSLARRAAVPVEIRAVPAERLAAPVEAAAYFVTSEALANVAKHAHASSVTITVTRSDDWVRLEVRDDGVGGADAANGSGLSGLRDRVEALDGHLEVTSPAAAGTTLRAEFPCA
jgi:signal transduction histidine kinase